MEDEEQPVTGEVLTIDKDRPEKLERTGVVFEFDARKKKDEPPEPKEFFKCGNCGKKLPRTRDPETDHHTAQKHAVEECPKRAQAQDEYRELLEEHEREKQLAIAAAQQPLLTAAQPSNRNNSWNFCPQCGTNLQ